MSLMLFFCFFPFYPPVFFLLIFSRGLPGFALLSWSFSCWLFDTQNSYPLPISLLQRVLTFRCLTFRDYLRVSRVLLFTKFLGVCSTLKFLDLRLLRLRTSMFRPFSTGRVVIMTFDFYYRMTEVLRLSLTEVGS